MRDMQVIEGGMNQEYQDLDTGGKNTKANKK